MTITTLSIREEAAKMAERMRHPITAQRIRDLYVPETVTLTFCGQCGALIHPAMLTEKLPECENCGEDISQLTQRAVGHFSVEDAALLEIANFGSRVSMPKMKDKEPKLTETQKRVIDDIA